MKKILIAQATVLIFAASIFGFSDDYQYIRNLYQYQQDDKQQQILENQRKIREYNASRTDNSSTQVGEVVVTARKTAETMGAVPGSLEILDPDEYELYGLDTLEKVMNTALGCYVSINGGIQPPASLSLRGAPSKQALIMVDGVPVTDIMTGGADLTLIDIEDINKIEVIRGGMSSIYGADASAGVVNVITGSDEKSLIKGSANYGTANRYRVSLASDYRIFNVDYSLSFTEEHSDDYFDNSEFYKRMLKGKVKFGRDNFISTVSGYYIKREAEIPFGPSGPTPDNTQSNENYHVSLEQVIDATVVTVKINGHLRSEDIHFVNPPYTDSRHIKKEYNAGVTGIYQEGKNITVTGGYEINLRNMESTDVGNPEMLNNGLFANLSAKLLNERLVIDAGARMDMNPVYGTLNSEHVAASYKVSGSFEVFGSTEKSFTAPTFGDLYWPYFIDVYAGDTYISEGNPDLKPEDAVSYNMGIRNKHQGMKEDVSWFYRDITNMISWQNEVSGTTTTSKPVNVDSAKVMGMEAQLEYSPFKFMMLKAQCSLMYIVDDSHNTGTSFVEGGNRLDGIYRIFAKIALPFSVTAGITAEYVDIDKDKTGKDINPYFLTNIRLTHKMNNNLSLYLKAENLFDNRDYEVVSGYPMPGRVITAGMDGKF